jgi:hypothetical protein
MASAISPEWVLETGGAWLRASERRNKEDRRVIAMRPNVRGQSEQRNDRTRVVAPTHSDKTRASQEIQRGHVGSSWQLSEQCAATQTSAAFDLQEALQMIDSTVFELTRNAWVVWASFMGLWTSVQVLFSLARPRQ